MLYCQPLATPHNVAKQWNGKRKVRIYTENTTLSQAKHKFFNKGGTLAGILLKVSNPVSKKSNSEDLTMRKRTADFAMFCISSSWKRDYLIAERWKLS